MPGYTQGRWDGCFLILKHSLPLTLHNTTQSYSWQHLPKGLPWSLFYFSITSSCSYPIQYLAVSEYFVYWFVWASITKYHEVGDKIQVNFVSCENTLPNLLPSGCVLSSSSYKTTKSILRALASWPNYLPNTPTQNTITLGFGDFNTWILVGHKHSVYYHSILDLGPLNRAGTIEKTNCLIIRLEYPVSLIEKICFVLAAEYNSWLPITNIHCQSNLAHASSVWWLDWFHFIFINSIDWLINYRSS